MIDPTKTFSVAFKGHRSSPANFTHPSSPPSCLHLSALSDNQPILPAWTKHLVWDKIHPDFPDTHLLLLSNSFESLNVKSVGLAYWKPPEVGGSYRECWFWIWILLPPSQKLGTLGVYPTSLNLDFLSLKWRPWCLPHSTVVRLQRENAGESNEHSAWRVVCLQTVVEGIYLIERLLNRYRDWSGTEQLTFSFCPQSSIFPGE